MKRASKKSVKPLPCYRVEVTSKFGQDDPNKAALASQFFSVGLPANLDVRVSSLYEVEGPLTKNQAQQLSRELLTDPVTQESRMDNSTTSPAFLIGPHWRVEVWLKPTVTDPVGESVCRAAGDLGLPLPKNVRTGTAYRILGRVKKAHVEKLIHKLLANPVIHRTEMKAT